MLRFTILASGSSGNCAFLETDHARILIDAGLSGRQIERRLSGIHRSLKDIQAVFVTHEHSDHVAGLKVIANRHGIPVFCTRQTGAVLRKESPGFQGWKFFEPGESMSVGDLRIQTFSVPHDAYDPVGFVFQHAEGEIGFLTDLGYATQLVKERVRGVRALVLEANYDPAMLQADTKRPWQTKQRILSRHGHLSNEAAAELAAELVTDRLQDLYLGHLSRDCNTPELAESVVKERLKKAGASHVRIHRTSPDLPCQTLVW